MRILLQTFQDIKLQFRYGFFLLYTLVTLFYKILLYWMPESWRPTVLLILLFADASIIGLIFIGAILLFEKAQGVWSALFISPLKISEYIGAKLISLGFITLLFTLALLWGEVGLLTIIKLMPGILLSSFIFTNIGLFTGIRSKGLNDFLLKLIGWFIILLSPLLLLFLPIHPAWFLWIPSWPLFQWLSKGVFGLSIPFAGMVIMMIWLALTSLFTIRRLNGSIYPQGARL